MIYVHFGMIVVGRGRIDELAQVEAVGAAASVSRWRMMLIRIRDDLHMMSTQHDRIVSTAKRPVLAVKYRALFRG